MSKPTSPSADSDLGVPQEAGHPRTGFAETKQLKDLRRAILRAHPDHAGADPRLRAEFARLVREYQRLSGSRSESPPHSGPRPPAPRQSRGRARNAGWAWGGVLLSSLLIVGVWIGTREGTAEEPPPIGGSGLVRPPAKPTLVYVPAPAATRVPYGRRFGPEPEVPFEYEQRFSPTPSDNPFNAPWLMAPLDESLVPFRQALESMFRRRSGLAFWPPPVPMNDTPAWRWPPAELQGRYPAGPEFARQAREASKRIAPLRDPAND